MSFWLILLGAGWPDSSETLRMLSPAFPESFGHKTIFLDAGHGAPGNEGNLSAACLREAEVTLRLSEDLAQRLEQTGHFTVVQSRTSGQIVSYSDRLAAATAAKADVFLSLHTDNRVPRGWERDPTADCPRLDEGAGFTVLWSDEGPQAQQRRALARAVGRRMAEAGFPAYRGENYHGLYSEDEQVPGVMVDRHTPAQRIAFLRRPTMPSVIIETHHSWYLSEAQRWEEPRTLEVFGESVTAALVDYFTAPRSRESSGSGATQLR